MQSNKTVDLPPCWWLCEAVAWIKEGKSGYSIGGGAQFMPMKARQ